MDYEFTSSSVFCIFVRSHLCLQCVLCSGDLRRSVGVDEERLYKKVRSSGIVTNKNLRDTLKVSGPT